jgi:hypothetical protein
MEPRAKQTSKQEAKGGGGRGREIWALLPFSSPKPIAFQGRVIGGSPVPFAQKQNKNIKKNGHNDILT